MALTRPRRRQSAMMLATRYAWRFYAGCWLTALALFWRWLQVGPDINPVAVGGLCACISALVTPLIVWTVDTAAAWWYRRPR